LVLLSLTGLAAAQSAFAAEAPSKLWTKCPPGSGAGQCEIPRGIGTDPTTGHLYVADQANDRIEEFTAWGEFVKAWGWGVRDGSAELQTCGPQATPPSATCFEERLRGPGTGQFNTPQGVAVDSVGEVYVVDWGNHRVQKFSAAGDFLLMFGGNVNKTKVEAPGSTEAEKNLCPVAPGDVCQAGTTGTGNGQFETWPVSSFIAAAPGNKIYVGDVGRIQQFEANGSYVKSIALPEETVQSLAADPAGNLYLAAVGKENVRKLDPTKPNPAAPGEVLCPVTVPRPTALATGPAGQLYVVSNSNGVTPLIPTAIAQFDSACGAEGSFNVQSEGFGKGEKGLKFSTGIATGAACYTAGKHGLYAANSDLADDSFVRAYGPPPDKLDGGGDAVCPAPPHDPSIEEQSIVGAEPESTTVRALINPHFWPDTTYYVEYGPGQCSAGDCDQVQPLSPAALGGGITENDLATANVVLTDLEPGTKYHFRFVAESGGGGPVYGIDPDGEEGPKEASFAEGLERSFITPPPDPCPPECGLPDNRAYEQVSPIDKSGFDINYGPVIARPDGGAVAFGSLGAFAGSRAGAMPSTYVASRGADWQSGALAPPTDPVAELVTGKVMGASGDLGKQLVATNAKLTPEAVEDDNLAVNIYIHDSATDSYQYVATSHAFVPPVGPIPNGAQGQFLFYAQFVGASEDGSRFFFSTQSGALGTTPDGPAGEGTGPTKLYEFDTTSGQLAYVGVLPDESVDPGGSQGAGAASANPASALPFHPVADDGQRVYWSGSSSRLYLREGGQSTLVSERQSDDSAQSAALWGTSADGGIAFLTSADKLTADASPAGTYLYRYDAGADQLTDLTPHASSAGVGKVLGVSADGTYVYFLAAGKLTAAASSTAPNLYAWHEGTTRLIGILGSKATELTGPQSPNDYWRLSASGRYLGFLFGGEIEGPHSTDPLPFRQAYLYDYVEDTLTCASCPPGGFASADVSLHELSIPAKGAFGTRSFMNSEVGMTRNVSDAGQFFFQSRDRLVSADVNGQQDVYEFELAANGTCSTSSASFSPFTGGCLRLISSGESANDSYFGDASPSGNDAFFLTRESLVLQDEDQLVDLYDARVGGGIASQNQPRVKPCDPEVNCQGPGTSPPGGQGAGPPVFVGPLDPLISRCKPGFVRKGGKCVKQHRKKGKKHHKHAKRGGRR
jgi:sugar lactone lactonase YvrE